MDKERKSGCQSIMITGASGAGKTSIVNELFDRLRDLDFKRIPGHTTRLLREGERDGFDFVFLSKSEFHKRFDEGKYLDCDLSVTYFNGNYYGSPVDWVDEIVSMGKIIITPTTTITAALIKKILQQKVLWAHLYVDDKERRRRLELRKIKIDEINHRLLKGDSSGKKDAADINIDTGASFISEIVETLYNFLI